MPMIVRAVCAVALLLLAGAAAPAARAAAGAICNVAATGLEFGHYHGSTGAPVDITGTIIVTCSATGQTAVPVAFTVALLGRGNMGARRMVAGRSEMLYRLYTDPARSTEWGDGTGGTAVINGSGIVSARTPLRQEFTVYGRLLARQVQVRTGRHMDLVPVLLNYR